MRKLFTISLLLICGLSLSAQLKKDGTPDMRYKANRQSVGISTPSKSDYNFTVPSYNFTAPTKTYSGGGTSYFSNETYKSTGFPKVQRSSSERNNFLRSRGYDKAPSGYEVDHIVPLSQGGADKAYNMQLLPKEVHRAKTSSERKFK